MNQYRCETCKYYVNWHISWKTGDDPVGACQSKKPYLTILENTYSIFALKGCASHSDYQSEGSIEQRLELEALNKGGTAGLGQYLLLRDIENNKKQSVRECETCGGKKFNMYCDNCGDELRQAGEP